MYLDTNVCEQSIQITDGASTSLKEINCESYYGSAIEWDTLSTHYLKIKFLDQSTQNQEGYFLLGFAVSDSNATFSLSCTSETESWCIDCGSLPTISFGRLQLIDGSNSGYDAKAQVVCDLGYEAEISTIKCLANATWEDSAVCSVKDCGTSFAINFGNATLNDVSNSAYGATATVTCDHGYNATKETITCAETGSWDTAECEPVDCGSLPTISFGRLQLIDGSNSGYDAKAEVVCDLGYEAELSTIKCLANATWEDSAVCSVKDCGTSFVMNYGNAMLNEVSNSTYGATATVTCDHGYTATKETITCAETGSWDTAECKPVDGSNGEDHSENTDESRVKDGGLAPGIIAAIVIASILVVIVVVIVVAILYAKCSKSQDISPVSDEKDVPLHKQTDETVQRQVMSRKESYMFSNR
ncbi:CUB and sushi domain-containing protein 3-like [Mercenaria mercenaria]|uniref:CUB and sushi domain-containing protein 3-like n=1 Tax=Mercenaria mercenaria TaxID=6596 RepID=UPI00234F1E1C|nr:CUB and sushi domain-containing protein 3-like [Mercenaria mercenaria]